MEGFEPVWRRGQGPQNSHFWGVRVLRAKKMMKCVFFRCICSLWVFLSSNFLERWKNSIITPMEHHWVCKKRHVKKPTSVFFLSFWRFNSYLELQTTRVLMVFSIGSFQIIAKKNGCSTKHPFKTGCLEFQTDVFACFFETGYLTIAYYSPNDLGRSDLKQIQKSTLQRNPKNCNSQIHGSLRITRQCHVSPRNTAVLRGY